MASSKQPRYKADSSSKCDTTDQQGALQAVRAHFAFNVGTQRECLLVFRLVRQDCCDCFGGCSVCLLAAVSDSQVVQTVAAATRRVFHQLLQNFNAALAVTVILGAHECPAVLKFGVEGERIDQLFFVVFVFDRLEERLVWRANEEMVH